MKNLIQTLIITTSLIILSGCGLLTKTEYIDRVKYVSQTVQHPAQPSEMSLLTVEFDVISKIEFLSLIDTVLAEEEISLSQSQKIKIANELSNYVFSSNEAIWTMNSQYYSNLGVNMQEIIRYIQQQKNLIIYYRETVAGPEDGISTKEEKQK
jgi:hypothetical protein